MGKPFFKRIVFEETPIINFSMLYITVLKPHFDVSKFKKRTFCQIFKIPNPSSYHLHFTKLQLKFQKHQLA